MLPYTETGSGESIVLFLHFFGSSQQEWGHVIARLDTRYRCVAADMPGFGDAAHLRGYTVSEMCAQVQALVTSFAPAPVALVAHSLSGKVAMVLAAEPPKNLKRLVLVGPSPLLPEPMTEEARARMLIANTTLERAEAFVRNGAHRPMAEEDVAIGIADVQRASPDAWRAWAEYGTREDWSDRVQDLRIPTTLVVGEYDEAIPLDFQRLHTLPLVERTGGRLVVIEDAAHMLPYEAAAELTMAIEDAVSAVATLSS
ncbi:putative hydrolase or acyltransferase of alpha/beta superfamily [Terriglobus roseus DSM 18391]|uniref:Putative hydrolase or acyltransferase of alpha/beta superfamily n=1 Tax=Terriglobus roseus (strain DSM 18391 / NRRL B-41598 / KBS 63) TaxID=926566 RepID=I3ZKP4_TERRK|nr:alpha/beta hydrolase [Terriglobus roseus]AFL89812.1 putative hydrolase or acyltransferase of alpha/beta superfamily [Terriglobus roseus DSM 18391]